MDVGRRIKLARAKAGMSLRDLAEKVGVSATAISKFERAEATPRQSTLLSLAKALSVGVEYFFREIRVDALAPAYRKHSALSNLEQDSVEAKIIEAVERLLTAEAFFPSVEGLSLPTHKVTSFEEAENASVDLRNLWLLGMDPIDDLCGRFESSGIKVIAVDGPEGFDGYSCWANENIPVIAFNRNVSGDRQRFSLAHELGHLIMIADGIDVEKAAHRFAAAFLVPEKSAVLELGAKRSNLSLDELKLLKLEYGTSMQAWIIRAFDLGIIDQDTRKALYRRLNTLGWRINEPGEVSNEEPRRLQLLVHRALAENLITPAYAATLLETPMHSKRNEASSSMLERAAELLAPMYNIDPELTEFANAGLGNVLDE